MTKRKKRLIFISSIIATCGFLIFLCLMALPYSNTRQGVEAKPDIRQRRIDSISCRWSTHQVKEGACWCAWLWYRQAGIALVPNKFCGRKE